MLYQKLKLHKWFFSTFWWPSRVATREGINFMVGNTKIHGREHFFHGPDTKIDQLFIFYHFCKGMTGKKLLFIIFYQLSWLFFIFFNFWTCFFTFWAPETHFLWHLTWNHDKKWWNDDKKWWKWSLWSTFWTSFWQHFDDILSWKSCSGDTKKWSEEVIFCHFLWYTFWHFFCHIFAHILCYFLITFLTPEMSLFNTCLQMKLPLKKWHKMWSKMCTKMCVKKWQKMIIFFHFFFNFFKNKNKNILFKINLKNNLKK